MKLDACLVPRRLPGDRFSFSTVRRGGRGYAVAVVLVAILWSVSHVVKGADPSVEVFSEDRLVTSASSEYETLVPQLPFRWLATVTGGYDDNVTTTPEPEGTAFTQAIVTVLKDLRTPRTKVVFLLNGGVIYYFDRSDHTDFTGNLNLSLEHGVSERLTLAAAINAAYRSEPDFTTDLGSLRRSNYFTTLDTLSARYLWSPRLSTYTSYQFGKVDYEDELVSDVQDRVDHTFGESLRYRWSERATVLGEYRFELIDYVTAPRDSTIHLALGGLEYQFTPRLTGSLLGGATFRKFKEGDGEWLIDPNGSVALNYFVSPSTNVVWTASYSVEEPSFSETLTQKTVRFRTGVRARYQPNSRATLELGFDYHRDENTGLLGTGTGTSQQDFTQNGFEFVLEGKYAIADRVALNLKYVHTDLDSLGGYKRNLYSAGFTFNF